MLNRLCGQGNFYRKCKTALKMINLRMELIMKKRKAMQKFLKTDIADLLRNNLDYNAYGRAEGLYLELNLSSCYCYVQECCKLVSDQLKPIHKERECPEECRVAVASVVHAASRFSDLLELRDVRTLFSDKYGGLDAFDIYVSKEFVEKLKSNPPTMEMKLQLMKDIAKEFVVEWEPASLESELNNQQAVLLQHQYNRSVYELDGAMSDDVLSEKEAIVEPERVIPTLYDDDEESNADEGDCRPTPKSVRSRFIKKPENATKNWDEDEELESKEMCGSRSATLNVNHLHPKMPDCDELASRIQALRNK